MLLASPVGAAAVLLVAGPLAAFLYGFTRETNVTAVATVTTANVIARNLIREILYCFVGINYA